MSLGTVGYNIVLVVHIFAIVAWMAGIFYLPRLFVYHADSAVGSQQAGTFKVMERKLYRGIMMPAIVMTWIAGLLLIYFGDWEGAAWLWVKLLFVVAMTVLHFWLGKQIKVFAGDANTTPSRTFRFINEVPTLLLLGILIMVVVKPF